MIQNLRLKKLALSEDRYIQGASPRSTFSSTGSASQGGISPCNTPTENPPYSPQIRTEILIRQQEPLLAYGRNSHMIVSVGPKHLISIRSNAVLQKYCNILCFRCSLKASIVLQEILFSLFFETFLFILLIPLYVPFIVVWYFLWIPIVYDTLMVCT